MLSFIAFPLYTVCSLGSDTAYSFRVSLTCFHLKHFQQLFSFFLSFRDIDIFEIYNSPTFYHCKVTHFVFDVFSRLNSGFAFLGWILHRWYCGLLLVSCLKAWNVRVLYRWFNLTTWSTRCPFSPLHEQYVFSLSTNKLWRDIKTIKNILCLFKISPYI